MLQRKVSFLFKDCVYKSLVQHHMGREVLFSHARSGTDHSVNYVLLLNWLE